MEFWKILLDDIKEPVSYLPMGVGAAIMMLLLLRLVAGEKAWKRPQVYYYFLLGVYETVVWIQAFFSRESGSRTGIDWQLFETWGRTWQSRAYMVENVIMFLPLGVLLPLAERRCAKWWKMLLMNFKTGVMQLYMGQVIHIQSHSGYRELVQYGFCGQLSGGVFS